MYVLLYFQLVRLDNLFAYWNVKSEMFYHGGCDESLVSKARDSVCSILVETGKQRTCFTFRPASVYVHVLGNCL